MSLFDSPIFVVWQFKQRALKACAFRAEFPGVGGDRKAIAANRQTFANRSWVRERGQDRTSSLGSADAGSTRLCFVIRLFYASF
jgi:hypothetical protein